MREKKLRIGDAVTIQITGEIKDERYQPQGSLFPPKKFFVDFGVHGYAVMDAESLCRASEPEDSRESELV